MKTLDKLLDEIDTFLATDPNGDYLWDILTALRGPDDKDWMLKERTTTIIRTAAFPKTARDAEFIIACFAPPERVTQKTLTQLTKPGWIPRTHFETHVRVAALALLTLDRYAAKPAKKGKKK